MNKKLLAAATPWLLMPASALACILGAWIFLSYNTPDHHFLATYIGPFILILGAALWIAQSYFKRMNTTNYIQEALLGVLLAALIMFAGRVEPKFLLPRLQTGLYSQIWDVALLAIPMTFVIITAGIDLSVGSIMALASVVMGMLFTKAGWSIPYAACAAVLTGLACGLLNGVFVTRVKVHPLIVTLATLSAFRGLAEGISLPDSFPLPDTLFDLVKRPLHLHLTQMPALYDAADRNVPLYAFQNAGWLFIIIAIFSIILLGATRYGRSIYAIGLNETAARFSGIRVDAIKLAIYAFSGLIAGVVAVNVSFGQSTAKADVGTGFELDAITAVVLGGTSIFGGKGRIIGTILGVILIHETRQFVKIHYHHEEWVSVVLGLLLILAVSANALLGRKSLKK